VSNDNLNEQQFGRRLGRSSVIKHLQAGGYPVGDYTNGNIVARQKHETHTLVFPGPNHTPDEIAGHLNSHPGMQASVVDDSNLLGSVYVRFPGNRPNPGQKYYDPYHR
jgi:hypothetical protein